MIKNLPFLLLLAIISASLFMVVESGEYYSTFYDKDYQGYWAAFLVEGFLTIAAILYLPEHKGVNSCIKIVMILLFVVVVSGASLKVVSPMMAQLAKAIAQNRLVDQLEKQNQQSIAHLAKLEGQRVNTALAIKHQREISNQLTAEIQKQTTAPWMIWVVMLFSTFLRFSVQLANLVFAHSLGKIWKTNGKNATSSAISKQGIVEKPGTSQIDIEKKTDPRISEKKILNYLKRNGGKANRRQILASRILNGGAKEYDRISVALNQSGKIKINREDLSKQLWMYSILK